MAQSITLSVVSISNDIASTATFSITEPGGATVTPSTCTKADLVSGLVVSVDSDTATSLVITATSGACDGIATSIVTWTITATTPTPTPTATATATPTPTPTETGAPTPTPTSTPTDTPTPTPTETGAPTPTPTGTPTATPTSTPTSTPTDTPTPTPTNTGSPVTNTPTPTPTSTPLPCLTYDVDNYDTVQNLILNYTDCNDGQVKQATFLPDSSYYLCSTTAPVRAGGSNSYQVSTGYSDPICANGTSPSQPTPTPTATPTSTPNAYAFQVLYSSDMAAGDLEVCNGNGTSMTVYSNCSSPNGSGQCRLYTSATQGTNYAAAGYYRDLNTNSVFYIEQSTGVIESVTQCQIPTPTATATPTPTPTTQPTFSATCFELIDEGGSAVTVQIRDVNGVTKNITLQPGTLTYYCLTAEPICSSQTFTATNLGTSCSSNAECAPGAPTATPTPTPTGTPLPAGATPTPTPTSAPLTTFFRTGIYGTGDQACCELTTTQIFFSPDPGTITGAFNNTTAYTDAAATTPFNGAGGYYGINDGDGIAADQFYVQIGTNGAVTTVSDCSTDCGGGGATS